MDPYCWAGSCFAWWHWWINRHWWIERVRPRCVHGCLVAANVRAVMLQLLDMCGFVCRRCARAPQASSFFHRLDSVGRIYGKPQLYYPPLQISCSISFEAMQGVSVCPSSGVGATPHFLHTPKKRRRKRGLTVRSRSRHPPDARQARPSPPLREHFDGWIRKDLLTN